MIYSLSLLTTIADCDLAIQAAALEKADLQFKRYSLEKKRISTTTTTASIEAQIPALEAEIAAYETVLDTLPAGEAKDELQSKATKAKYKLFILQEKRASYGVLAVLELELEMAFIDASMDEATAQIEAVSAHKDTL